MLISQISVRSRHFTGYNTSDSGTSAATPIAAGVCALLKDARASLTHDQIKRCLMDTSKDIGPSGFDRHSGAGIIQAWDAYRRCARRIIATLPRIDTSTVRDRITIATRDTSPTRDRFTIASRDTNPRLDRLTTIDRDTSPTRDRFTRVQIDTSPVRDRLTNVIADRRGTPPRIDWVKQPHLDTRDEHLRRPPVVDRAGRPIRGGDRPMVLSTPHHAEEWQEFDEGYDGYNDAEMSNVDLEIEELQQRLAELTGGYEEDAYGKSDCGCQDSYEDADYDDPDAEYYDDEDYF